jgi:hypothetical protein
VAPPLVDQLENLEHTALCQACMGSGYDDDYGNQRGPEDHRRLKRRGVRKRKKRRECVATPLCWVCRGNRVIFTNRTCECGWPAVFWSDEKKVWSCGDQTCVDTARARLDGKGWSQSFPGGWSQYAY